MAHSIRPLQCYVICILIVERTLSVLLFPSLFPLLPRTLTRITTVQSDTSLPPYACQTHCLVQYFRRLPQLV